MDGNGRWAKARFMPRAMGHRAGVKAARRTIEAAVKHHIPYLTLFAFGQENWQRPQEEVGLLMDLILQSVTKELPLLKQNNIRLRMIGSRQELNPSLQAAICFAEEETCANTGMQLFMAVNYSGHWDIQQAISQFLEVQKQQPESHPTGWQRYLSMHGVPAPDLLIRTSGEQRISNFCLWDLAYSELYFCQTLWPDFDEVAFENALAFYAGRERRFGQVLEEAPTT